MTEKDTYIPKDNTKIYDSYHEVVVGNKTYLVKRHFTGNRDFSQAIFAAMTNEAKRDDSIIQAG